MNNVDDFLKKLEQQAPSRTTQSFEKRKTIDKIYCNTQQNFGRYMIFPLDSLITDYPFVYLEGTREIKIPRKNISNDGQETVYNAWIKLLPEDAYVMKDMTGRVVSSLTEADKQLLNQAYMVFDELYRELDPMNNRDKKEIYSLIRKRNYTIFHGYCLNKWDLNTSRTPSRQNFSALFVITAKSFLEEVKTNISEKSTVEGGNDWIYNVYNRQLTNRDGFFMFTVGPEKSGRPGFSISVTHEYKRSSSLAGFSIPEEDAELMTDPVQTFLGWQANRDDQNQVPQKRLFNANLIKEAIEFMSSQLAAVRTSKQTGEMSIEDAIKVTTNDALSKQAPTAPNGQISNDPVLNKMAAKDFEAKNASPVNVANTENVINNNNNPFETPAAAHIDPITGTPVNFQGQNNNSPFVGGNFGGNNGANFVSQPTNYSADITASENDTDDLPF